MITGQSSFLKSEKSKALEVYLQILSSVYRQSWWTERWPGSEQVREASQAERWAGIRAQRRGDDPPKVVVVVVVRAVRKVRVRMTGG